METLDFHQASQASNRQRNWSLPLCDLFPSVICLICYRRRGIIVSRRRIFSLCFLVQFPLMMIIRNYGLIELQDEFVWQFLREEWLLLELKTGDIGTGSRRKNLGLA
ncbi:unnamed protein product [Arabidopsis lyrata]|nr:unnamed protein product [Arabidopsis lyrata]